MGLWGNPICCFHNWSGWHPSSLTCGRICEHRTRNIWYFGELAENECNYDHESCPDYEREERFCVNTDCREYDF